MHREPYYDHYPKIKDLSLEDFVKFSIEDYENCIAMWNQKNDSYFRMSEEVPNSIVVNVEDFHADQQKFHERMADVSCNHMCRWLRTFVHASDQQIPGRKLVFCEMGWLCQGPFGW